MVMPQNFALGSYLSLSCFIRFHCRSGPFVHYWVSFGHKSSRLYKHRIIVTNTINHMTIRHAAKTQPNICSPLFCKALPSAVVAVTSAVFGKTNDHHVIWKGILLSGRTYFQSDPTETMKNHMLRPQSHSPIRTDMTLMMGTARSVPRKLLGRILSAELPS